MTMINAEVLAVLASKIPQCYLEIAPSGHTRIVTGDSSEIVCSQENTDVWTMELMDYTCTITVRGALRDVIEVAAQLGVS